MHNNLAVLAARYGVDNTRAQRLIASVRPNPTLTDNLAFSFPIAPIVGSQPYA